jgi:hypothetical protein
VVAGLAGLAVLVAGRRATAGLARRVRRTTIAGRRGGKWAKQGPFRHVHKTMATCSQYGADTGAALVPRMQVG